MKSLFLLAVLVLGGVEVYRWTDANGVVHYSDRPQEGAEKVILQSAPPSGSLGTPGAANRGTSNSSGATETNYELSIQSPSQDEVLWNIEGQLDVAARVEPSLDPGDRLQLMLDGQVVATLPPGSTQTRLSEVYRGDHTLVLEILDSSGNRRAKSPPVNFAVRQTSIANPVNPQVQPIPTPRRP